MRVLICSNAYPPNFMGGAELMAHEQAKALVRMGHEVCVFAGSLAESGARYAHALDSHEGITVHRITLVPEDYSAEYLNFLHPAVDKYFKEILQTFNPDVVHCHNLSGLSVKLPILAKRHGAATICTLHDFWGFCLRNTAIRADGLPCDDITQCRSCVRRIHDGRKQNVSMRFRKDFIRLALEQVDRFVAPSRFIAGRYIQSGFDAARVNVVANGVDTARFRPHTAPCSTEMLRITYAGYLGAHKGIDTLLEALALVAADWPQVTLQLAGEGPERAAYQARAKDLGIVDRVRFLGRIEPMAMPHIYADSDVVVLPSIWDENQPVCLMEAMACGIAVVASRKGGIPELIAHAENGLLFNAGDVRDLAGHLSALVADPDLRASLGRTARESVAGCSHDEQARHLTEIYHLARQVSPSRTKERLLFAALGSHRHRMRDEAAILDDGRFRSRNFVPRAWVSDVIPRFDGWILTGLAWSFFRRLHLNAMLPFRRFLARR